jgi:hypothetical protein
MGERYPLVVASIDPSFGDNLLPPLRDNNLISYALRFGTSSLFRPFAVSPFRRFGHSPIRPIAIQ